MPPALPLLTTADALLFASPPWLWAALVLVPAAAALFLWAERRAGQRLARLIAARLRTKLAGADSPGRRRARFTLLTGALAALAVALARPQLGYEEQSVKRRGLDLLMAVDVSKSMLATDLAPNRLGRARLAILDLLGLLPGDRVGLIAFAGTAFLQAPLTIDYEAIRAAVAELDPDLIPRGGTNLAAAVDLALDAFGKGEGGHRAILLFTDGEELEDDAVKAAGRAAEAGVKVFTVGLGSAEGALVPLPRSPYVGSQGPGEFARDRSGGLVRSKLDETRLRQIADAAGGSYVHLTNLNAENDMKTLVRDGLGALQTAEIDARVNRRPIERFQWPLGFSLLCLGASALLGERRRASRPSSQPTAVTSAPRRPAAAAVSLLMPFFLFLVAPAAAVLRAAAPSPDPLELYGQGKYADAYDAYGLQLKKRPDSGQLQFNAGASAFMAGQYDPALEAFSHALAAKDADAALQAKTFYNLGNTLARRGDTQKETSDARLNDYKNAIQYYNSVLQSAPTSPDPKAQPDPGSDPLRQNAAHNRDLVQRRLDEEMKKRQQQKPPPQPSPKPDDKKDQKDKSDQKKDKPQKPPPKPDQPPKDPSTPENGPSEEQNPGQGGEPKDDSPPGQSGSSDQPPQPDPKDEPKDGRPPKKPDSKPDKNDGKPGDDQDPDDEKPASGPDQAPSPAPGQDGPRPQGELTARDAGEPPPSPGDEPAENPAEGADAQSAKGRMSPREARALLNALRGEDDKVMLNNPGGKKARREPVYNDW